MAISQSKYINIVSSTGGTAAVQQRSLMGRVFTTNYLVPTGQVVEFSGGAIGALSSIANYFGTTSAEYAFAVLYFQENNINTPQAISFARYASEATSATLIGSRNASTLAQLQAITDGTLDLVINGETQNFSSINLSSAESLADVASTLTSTVTSAGVTVTYDDVNTVFVLQTTATGSEQSLGYATGTVASALGWIQGVGIISDGSDATSALDTVTQSAELSNNFFSFCFLTELTTADITAIAQWVSSQNVKYMYSVTVTPDNAGEIRAAVETYTGVALTLDKFNENAGFMPMSRIAAVDYTKPNSTISMNYQQFAGVQPSVQTDSEVAIYDPMNVNYYGSIQQAGQTASWYQNGVLQGDITDMGVYANEAWLKDNIATNLLNLRVALNTLPANNTGLSLVLAQITQSINVALLNGTILPGKTLNSTQKAFIAQITGVSDAWQTVQNAGYYLTASIEQPTSGNYQINYLLVYSKGDSINYIDGSDILI